MSENKTRVFIEKAKQKHGDRYDYSKVDYIRNSTNVIIVCREHGEFLQRPCNHLNGAGCKECAKRDRANTNQERYGHPNIAHGIKKDKIKQTMIEKYGTTSNLSSPIMREQIKQTFLERYCVTNPSLSPVIQEKRKQTLFERYGHENPAHGVLAREKIKQTMIERYGVEYSGQSKEIQEKMLSTQLKKYGGRYIQQHMLSYLPLLLDFDWLYNQYVINNKTATKISNEFGITTKTVIKYLKQQEITIRSISQYSYSCINWLETIMEQEQIPIQHALNGGEYQIPGTKYKVDGYCQETNTIYEFHGDIWHGNPKLFNTDECCHPWSDLTAGELYQKTIEREEDIKKLGYNLVTIWESDFNENKSRIKHI